MRGFFPASRDIGSVSSDDALTDLSLAASGWTSEVAILASRTSLGVGILVGWAGVGVLIAAALGRRGHDFRSIAALGVLLGPLLLGAARANLIPLEEEAEPIEIDPGSSLGGHKRAVVALLGQPGDAAAAAAQVRAWGPELGELVLIRPVPYEHALGDGEDEVREAAAALKEAARFFSGIQPRLLIVPGRGRHGIQRYLADRRADFTVVVEPRSKADPLTEEGPIMPEQSGEDEPSRGAG